MMLKCKQATMLMSESQERSLSVGERLALKVHLSMCRGCRNFDRQLPVLRGIARRFANGAKAAADEAPNPRGEGQDRD